VADGNGYLQFETNDPAYLNSGWYDWDLSTNQATTSWTTTVTIIKNSGAIGNGAGIIFCYSDASNFYRVLVAWNGGYRIDKKVAGAYSTIQGWSSSVMINKGLSASNEISVQEIGANNYFLSINSVLVTNFTDSSLATGGMGGFYVSVGTSGSENFPYNSVDVRFKMTSPVSFP
jgi:hypothetical protein